MNKPKIVLFDIDYTLFDVAKFREKIFKSIIDVSGKKEQTDIKENLEKIYYESRKELGYFKMDAFLKDVNKKLKSNISLNILENGMFLNNLYEEAEDILRLISKDESIIIGIFSGGESGFQFKKIEHIVNFFNKDHIHIIKYKHLNILNIIQKYKNLKIYLIDDMLDILYKAKKIDKDMTTVWIKRGRFAKNAKPIKGFKPDYEIKNLRNLPSIINSN